MGEIICVRQLHHIILSNRDGSLSIKLTNHSDSELCTITPPHKAAGKCVKCRRDFQFDLCSSDCFGFTTIG